MKLFNRLKQEHPMFFISLIWLGFPLYFSMQEDYPVIMIVATVLSGVFYIASLIVKNTLVLNLMWIYMAVYISVLSSYFSPFNAMMFMYLSSLLNYKFLDFNIKSFRNITFYLAILFVYIAATYNYTNVYIRIAVIVVLFFCLFMHISSRIDAKDTRVKYEKMKQHEYINSLIAENERNRIARDLHDSLGHIFVSLNLKAELAEKFINKGMYKEAAGEISEINKTSKIYMKQVREIVSNISYKSLAEEIDLARENLNLAEIEVDVSDKFTKVVLSKTEESALVMLVRELTNNILKHSQATSCKFKLQESSEDLILEVSDNGVGFKSKDVELKNIKDRLMVLNGVVEIASIKEPTQIRITIPRERL